MAFATYDYDIEAPKEDCVDCVRSTYIRRMNVTVIDCGAMLHSDICDLWNNTRCTNDECYCNPYIEGDKIYLQFSLPIPLDKLIGWFNLFGTPQNIQTTCAWGIDYFASLIDENGDDITGYDSIGTFASQYGIGVLNSGKPYMWMEIDTTLIQNIDYFNIKIRDAYTSTFYTEPYCRVKCDQQTILVRGTYNKFDPFGGFYGDFLTGAFTGNQNGYQAQIRVYGNIEKTSNTIEKTNTELVNITTKVSPVYLLRTHKLPEYVADLLTVALAGQQIFIDGVEYESPTSVDKNNPEGSMWLVESTITLLTDEIDFEC